MKKLRLKLEAGRPLGLDCIDTGVSLMLTAPQFDIQPHRAYWEVLAEDPDNPTLNRLISGTYGVERPFWPAWPGSWIALSGPITLHVGGGTYRPEFVLYVPRSVEWVSQGDIRRGAR